RDTGDGKHVAFLRVSRQRKPKRLGRHGDPPLRNGRARAGGLSRHVDHVRLSRRRDVGEPAHLRHSLRFALARRSFRYALSFAGAPCSSSRVAASTLAFRIRLSPTRKVKMCDLSRRRQSSCVSMPLSETRILSLGARSASLSLVSSETLKS